MTIRYEMILYGREVDQAFIVEVPELPGCATYQEAAEDSFMKVKYDAEEF